jgi:hypothetical protein
VDRCKLQRYSVHMPTTAPQDIKPMRCKTLRQTMPAWFASMAVAVLVARRNRQILIKAKEIHHENLS